MGIAYDYLTRQHSKAYADAIELDRVRSDIAGMKAQLEKVTKDLAGAEQYAAILTNSISTAQQLVEDECKRNGWPLPEPPAEPPAPAPIADRITRETTGTLAFEAVKAAIPVEGEGGGFVCGHALCGLELFQENDVFIHAATGLHMCKDQTTAPSIQQGTDGSPVLTTILPAHGVEVTRDDA